MSYISGFRAFLHNILRLVCPFSSSSLSSGKQSREDLMEAPQLPSSTKVTHQTISAIGKAVEALKKWVKSKSESDKAQLFEQEDFLYLVLTLKKIPPKGRTNPYKIPLPHPFHPSEEFCLIIDDRPKSNLTSDLAKKKIQADNIPIKKVLKLSKLKSDYRPFEAKRKLCNSFEMFFADKRIIPLLPRLLGKEFFKKKKTPIPIDLTHKNWKEQVQKVCESALFYMKTGTCSVVKVARVSQGGEEIVENVHAAIDGAVEIVRKKWENVRSIHLKVSESVALPVYQAVPTVGLKIEGVSKKEDEQVKNESEEGLVAVKEKKSGKKKAAKKGRIHEVRYMDSNIGDLMASDDDVDEGNENGMFESDELPGTKKKKADKKVKKRVLEEVNGQKESKRSPKVKKPEEVNGQKESKRSPKVKKPDGAKKKKDELSLPNKGVDDEVVGTATGSTGLKKEKKKSETGKAGSAEMKKKSKKSN